MKSRLRNLTDDLIEQRLCPSCRAADSRGLWAHWAWRQTGAGPFWTCQVRTQGREPEAAVSSVLSVVSVSPNRPFRRPEFGIRSLSVASVTEGLSGYHQNLHINTDWNTLTQRATTEWFKRCFCCHKHRHRVKNIRLCSQKYVVKPPDVSDKHTLLLPRTRQNKMSPRLVLCTDLLSKIRQRNQNLTQWWAASSLPSHLDALSWGSAPSLSVKRRRVWVDVCPNNYYKTRHKNTDWNTLNKLLRTGLMGEYD